MKHTISIKPYTEYWLNCVLSLNLSIICSLDQSYYDYAISNNYTYVNFGNCIWWRLLEVQFNDDMYVKAFEHISNKPIEGITRENLKETIKKYIDENRMIMLKLDIYHTIEDSIHYHRTHRPHEWLINGYDDETGMFYCFADNIGGYGENEISAANFELSIIPETFTDAVEVYANNDIEPYVLTLDEVRKNAKEHLKSITRLSYCNFWKCDSIEYTEDRCFDMSKFIGRQHANSILFRRLYELGYICKEIQDEMCQISNELERTWMSIRGRFMKYYLGGKVPDYGKMSKLAWTAINRECDMWRRFINVTETKGDT